MQKKRIVGLVSIAMMFLASTLSAQESGSQTHEKSKSWEMLKNLEGDWIAQDDTTGKAGRIALSYKLTSTGNAIVETYDPGLPTEEITLYFHDGDNLVLTHFCALGNQARMQLDDPSESKQESEKKKVSFSCIGPSNVASEDDGHMHRMTISFVDEDHLKTVWTMHKDGKKAQDFPFDLKRRTE